MVNSAILLYSANKLADHIYYIKKRGGAYNSNIIWFFVKSFISDLNGAKKQILLLFFNLVIKQKF